ncbi:MAG: OmpA family protein [Desulfovibrionaceae bacterium]|nr:OmpA family protein [Desulfovibrionaceae bacterium]
MKFSRLVILTVALVFAWATSGFAFHSADQCEKRIDNFEYFVDYSGSMMMNYKTTGKSKMAVAKEVLQRVNDAAVVELGYKGGLNTFAPYSTVVPMGTWDRASMKAGISSLKSDLPVFGRFTPMGDGIADNAPVVAGMVSNSAVILVTDGGSNRGIDPVEEVKKLYAANPNVTFHVISLANDPEGQAVADAISALSSRSVSVRAIDLYESDAAVDKFVGDVFCMPRTNAPIAETIVLRGVNFAFDSYELTQESLGVLNEAARIIIENGKSVCLSGWTDSKGSDAYNKTLSQRRAEAVRAYLVSQGVSSSKLVARGMGKSFRYDNATEEGRYQNRRTELVFID